MPDEFERYVIDAATKLDLVNGEGQMVVLDSLAIIDLAIEIEEVSRIRIPPANLTVANFTSVGSVAGLRRDLSSSPGL
jgi:acyl carrier protein